MKWLSVMVLAASCAACNSAADQTTQPVAGTTAGAAAGGAVASAPAVKPVSAPAVREVTLPVGTELRLELTSAIGSDTSKVEDAVRAELRQPVVVDGKTILASGTEVAGTVTDVERPGRVKGRARIAYRFDSLRRSGERYEIQTAALAHTAEATKGSDAKKIAIGAGAGAALGALLGGGDGAAKGAAIGGAGGTGVVLATRGKDVHLAPGADVTTRLTAPLTIRVRG